MIFGSLFAGIGGFDLGFERAGLRCAWQVEIDPAAQATLARHWPDVPRFADVRDCGAHDLSPVDVICFGSPCQDLSIAGRRAGLNGERSGLFYEAIRIIRELRPAIIVWENVPDTLSSHRGRDFAAVLDAVADAGALDIAWRVLDARWFGVAQRRRRLFVVADFRAERAAEILFEPPRSGRCAPESGQAGQELAGTLTACAGRSRGAASADDMTLVAGTLTGTHPSSRNGGSKPDPSQFVVGTLTAGHPSDWQGGATPALIANTLTGGPPCRGAGHGKPSGEGRDSNLIVANTIAASLGHHGHSSPRGDGSDNLIAVSGTGAGYWREGLGPLTANDDTGDKHLIALTNRAAVTGDQTETLRAASHGALPLVAAPAVVRRLTPIECARLQGFPDDWIAASDSVTYRLLGNAVALPVAEWIGRRLIGVMGRTGQ